MRDHENVDMMHAIVQSNCLAKTVDLSKHRLSVVFPIDAFSSSHSFCNMILFELKNIVDKTVFWDEFLFVTWGRFLPLGTRALHFSFRFIVVHACFITGNNFTEMPCVTIVMDMEERFWVCSPTALGFFYQNMRDPPGQDLAVVEFVIQNVWNTPWWNVKCFSYFLNGNLFSFICHGLYTSDQLSMTLCLIFHFTLMFCTSEFYQKMIKPSENCSC